MPAHCTNTRFFAVFDNRGRFPRGYAIDFSPQDHDRLLAELTRYGEQILGTFDSYEEAHRAVQIAIKQAYASKDQAATRISRRKAG
jgi:hypothetical protein